MDGPPETDGPRMTTMETLAVTIVVLSGYAYTAAHVARTIIGALRFVFITLVGKPPKHPHHAIP